MRGDGDVGDGAGERGTDGDQKTDRAAFAHRMFGDDGILAAEGILDLGKPRRAALVALVRALLHADRDDVVLRPAAAAAHRRASVGAARRRPADPAAEAGAVGDLVADVPRPRPDLEVARRATAAGRRHGRRRRVPRVVGSRALTAEEQRRRRAAAAAHARPPSDDRPRERKGASRELEDGSV